MERLSNSTPPDDTRQRVDLIVWVTAQVLATDESLTFCAGLRLIEAARTSVLRFFPEEQDSFDTTILPHLQTVLHRRFGLTGCGPHQ